MANLITNHKGSPADSLMMNNGLTSIVLEALVLSGSSLAQSGWEEELICWLAEHDQGVFGAGIVGFDLDEIAWNRERFAGQSHHSQTSPQHRSLGKIIE